MTKQITREQWLNEASNHFLSHLLMPIAKEKGFERPPFKVSIGFPHGSRKAIGQCFRRKVSEEGYNEIYIRPDENRSVEILDTLIHELIHAIDDCKSGHKGFFRYCATKAGLEGRMTSTYAGEALKSQLIEYVDYHGDIPHAKLDFTKSGRKKQTTRMIKLECECCGFVARTTRKWLEEIYSMQSVANCPCCDNKTLEADV